MSGNELKHVTGAVDTNWVTQGGPHVEVFEQRLAEYLGNGVHVAATTSGTSAIHLALVMLGVGPGDFVLCQSLTFVASANPVLYLGAKPVFIDSESETWNLCPEALEAAIISCIASGQKPKVIITVSLYGMPYKVDEITALSRKYGIPVLEDSAEALGSTYDGQPLGTFGDMAVISFNGNKIITTSGGGALITRDKKIRDRAVFLSTQAKDAAAHYEHSVMGFNYRMSNISAGIGLGQMEVLHERIAQRRANHEFYHELFSAVEGVTLLQEPDARFVSNHWLTVVQINPDLSGGITREQLRLALLEENIKARPVWKPMHLQPLFKGEAYFGGTVAENLFAHGLCLPSGSGLSAEGKERIAAVIRQVLSR